MVEVAARIEDLGAAHVTVVEAGLSLSEFQGGLPEGGKNRAWMNLFSIWVNLCS